ncbi:MAG: 3-hydroxyacyl-CoA dehydrogenase family protein [Acidobacteria bacterium]|nr:3-hydroxyacyl-CoA dehydrogenase family protein [Acidobacteriota bacterium]
MDTKDAVVIGTGAMGPGIAACLALAGACATIVSRTANGAAKGVSAARAVLKQLEENDLAPGDRVAAAGSRLAGSDNLSAAAASCDLVIEAIVEDMSLKKELFARLDRVAPETAILASCTSGLSITEIARATARPARVITAHFWNPPHLMPLVEVVKGEKTGEAVITRTMSILRDLGKTPVLLRQDRPGQLGNRIQSALMREAMSIVCSPCKTTCCRT